MSKNQVDICFVGGGIGCLYAAYRLLKKQPNLRIVILERNDRLGGRAHNVQFHGVEIPEGAGVGRFRKDKLLRNLLLEMDIPIHKFRSPHVATFQTVDVTKIVEKLRDAVHKYDRHTTTFSQFAKSELGNDTYKRFVQSCGYSDFEYGDLVDTVEHYGFDDTQDQNLFYVPWNLLVERLTDHVMKLGGANSIMLSTTVHGIDTNNGNQIIVSHSNGSITCKNVVIGTTISAVRGLMPSMNHLYDNIQAQPFLRIYAKISPRSKEFIENVATYTVIQGDHQKIIPMNPEKGVYMIAYSDNKHALRLSEHAYEKNYLQKSLSRATGIRDIIIEDLYVKYWMEGTHYFKPLPSSYKTRAAFVKKAQRPLPHVYVIGEAISTRYQGWTQGALESVNAVLDDI